MNLQQAVREATRRLAAAGSVSAAAEARTLAAWVLGTDVTRLPLIDFVTPDQSSRLDAAVDQCVAGTPVQLVTGRAYFRRVEVHVGPGVFIPRPETECLAGWAIRVIQPGVSRVVELCAGSGALSLALADEARPGAAWAVERSAVAYGYLTANLDGTAVTPVHAAMAEALPELDGGIDVVVANPPYVPDGTALPPAVGYDPAEALFSGPDGLDATREVAAVAYRLLKPKGVVGSEHGDDQGDAVRDIFRRAGFTDVTTHPDLTGRPRFVTARRADVE